MDAGLCCGDAAASTQCKCGDLDIIQLLKAIPVQPAIPPGFLLESKCHLHIPHERYVFILSVNFLRVYQVSLPFVSTPDDMV